MKKSLHLLIALGLLSSFSANAQLLKEDFEAVSAMPPEGWTVKNDPNGTWTTSGTESNEYWKVVVSDRNSLSGKGYATVGGFHASNKNEQWLMTPEVTLEQGSNYKLDFLWESSPSYAIDKKQFAFVIKAQVAGSEDWVDVFDFASQEDIEASGVKWPWGTWAKNNSIIDISDYAGKSVKFAFVWTKMVDGYGANLVDIDDVIIDKYTPVTLPHIESATSSYVFSNVYIGQKKYSEAITLKNTGAGDLKITGIEGLDGTDFSTTLDIENLTIKPQETAQFQVVYTPTKLGAASATMTLETNGDNSLDIKLSGTKTLIPSGYTYEGFESGVFPPLGWTKNGDSWVQYNSAGLSGDKCIYGTVSMSETSDLISPRLDLSGDDEYFFTFDFFESFDSEDPEVTLPENYFRVSYSTDGGESWTQLLENESMNTTTRSKLSLGTPKSDNCYVKFTYYTPEISWDNVPETSVVFIDDVILPPLYGAAAAPSATTPINPQADTTNVSNRNLRLQWNGAQFAESYLVYLGTSADNFDLLNGVECTATEYAAPRLEYATTYYWKIVPKNQYGMAENAPVWAFTTMADQSIKEYPYFQGFENKALPLGWEVAKDGSTKWDVTNVGPYEGTYSMYAGGRYNDTEATLTTPEFVLPNEECQISFFWGNKVPVALTKDVTGCATNNTISENDIDAVYFEINTGDDTWKTIKLLSDKDNEYWLRECISLDEYKGKTVSFRWRYKVLNGMASSGAGLDNIKVEAVNGTCLAYFNSTSWDAGEVNYEKSFDSKAKLALINGSNSAMTVQNVSFGKENFTSDLEAGTVIEANKGVLFKVTFNAGTTAAKVDDEMTVTFSDGQSVKLPVSGTALAQDIFYYGFEEDEFGSTKPIGLTTVDVDGAGTVMPSMIKYPNKGGAFAYVVINVTSDCADWRNVYPHSGDQVLAAFASTSGNANDWIISPKMAATANSKFRFFGKSYGTTDDYNDFKPHYYSVLVSTTDTNTSSFEAVVSDQELAYSKEGKFTEYSVDLSKYAGQNVYVALKHSTTTEGFVAFFDDFYYEHFSDESGISQVALNNALRVYPNPVVDELRVNVADVKSVQVMTLDGQLVKDVENENVVNVSDLNPGMYVVTVKTADASKTVKIVKK